MYTVNDIYDIEFKVKKVVFSNPDTHFRIMTVSVLKQECTNKEVDPYLKKEETIQISLPVVEIGDVIRTTIAVRRNPKYGYFLESTTTPIIIMPESIKEMNKFLIRKLKGVGERTAEKLTSEYGMDVLSVIEQDEDAFTRIGISKARGEKVRLQVLAHQSFDKLSAFLYGMGIPMATIAAIYDKLGGESLHSIQLNPYSITEVENVPFIYADTIASRLKKDPLSPNRIESAIVQFIHHKMEAGDLCVQRDVLFKGLIPFLDQYGSYKTSLNENITNKMVEGGLKSLLKANIARTDTDKSGDTYIYLKHFYEVENHLVATMSQLLSGYRPPLASKQEVANYLKEMEENGRSGNVLATKQREAIFMAIENNLSILTGGPGTGKTHTLNTVVKVLKGVNPTAKIALLAPTGKAAKRMSEMTHLPAMTIHRKLSMSGFGSGEGITPIEEHFVVVDEVSMVDAELFDTLISNLSPHTRVLLVGDVDQLPSIGPGLILKDLINSNRIKVTMLNQVFRQAQDSQIIMNAHRLIAGKTTQSVDGIKIDNTKGDMYFVEAVDELEVRHKILQSFVKQVRKYKHPLSDVVILSPMKIGPLGSNSLNEAIQSIVNPRRQGVNEMEIHKDEVLLFREGDRVINLTNDTEKGIANGETGTVDKIYTMIHEDEKGTISSKETMEVVFPDEMTGEKVIMYTEDDIESIELAYAISIHKSQGSEFPVVVTPIHDLHARMLNRNLIYTAWTRAKDTLIVIGSGESLDKASTKVEGINRVSLIKEKLQDSIIEDALAS